MNNFEVGATSSFHDTDFSSLKSTGYCQAGKLKYKIFYAFVLFYIALL